MFKHPHIILPWFDIPYYTITSYWIPNNERHLALKVTGIDWSSSTGTGPFHLFLSQITHLFQSLAIRTIMNYPQIPTYQPKIKSHQADFSRWSAEASCYSQPLVFFSTPSPANVVAPSHHRTQKALNLKLAGLLACHVKQQGSQGISTKNRT